MELTLKKLCKNYSGNKALVNIDLHCKADSIYCLLGKNGAGKSTLINVIANLAEPTSGELLFDGLTYRDNEIEIKKQIGLLSQYDQLIGDLKAIDYLYWIGLLYGMNKHDIIAQATNLLNFFFDNDEDLNRPSANFSSGMKKKLAFCAAVIHKPALLLLDEPFANLDPVAAKKLCDFLIAYKNEDRVIFVSSHDLLYVNKIATHVGILSNAKLVYNDAMQVFNEGETKSIDEELFKYLKPKNDYSPLIDLIV